MTKKTQHPNNAHSAISEPAANKQHVFISKAHQLARWFSEPAWHNPNKAGKYLESGMKPIEEFCNDIRQNLIEWATEGDVVCYRTKKFTYMFQTIAASKVFHRSDAYALTGNIVWMTRFRNGTWQRLDDWSNPHSVEHIGRGFLSCHPDKQVPLFNN